MNAVAVYRLVLRNRLSLTELNKWTFRGAGDHEAASKPPLAYRSTSASTAVTTANRPAHTRQARFSRSNDGRRRRVGMGSGSMIAVMPCQISAKLAPLHPTLCRWNILSRLLTRIHHLNSLGNSPSSTQRFVEAVCSSNPRTGSGQRARDQAMCASLKFEGGDPWTTWTNMTPLASASW